MPVSNNMKPIAVDGELVLYADKARERGKIHDTLRNIWSDEMWLAALYKWGNFEPIEQEPAE